MSHDNACSSGDVLRGSAGPPRLCVRISGTSIGQVIGVRAGTARVVGTVEWRSDTVVVAVTAAEATTPADRGVLMAANRPEDLLLYSVERKRRSFAFAQDDNTSVVILMHAERAEDLLFPGTTP